MGLDMYFLKIARGGKPDLDPDACTEIKYFRKHSDLHGWLQDQWLKAQAGETDPYDFNCLYFKVTRKTLNGMKKLCDSKRKKKYEGFFWGESTGEDWLETRELCDEIQDLLNDGLYDVYYYSWW